LDSIQAAVLNAKLPLLDQYGAQDKMRHVNIQLHLKGMNINSWIFDYVTSFKYTLRIVDGDRDGLMKYCKDIPCAIYYPIPLHSQKAYLDARYKEEDFPVTNQLVKEVISLCIRS
jgi:dTDP-4-amino-4,6-dideoxygalactose transaminase